MIKTYLYKPFIRSLIMFLTLAGGGLCNEIKLDTAFSFDQFPSNLKTASGKTITTYNGDSKTLTIDLREMKTYSEQSLLPSFGSYLTVHAVDKFDEYSFSIGDGYTLKVTSTDNYPSYIRILNLDVFGTLDLDNAAVSSQLTSDSEFNGTITMKNNSSLMIVGDKDNITNIKFGDNCSLKTDDVSRLYFEFSNIYLSDMTDLSNLNCNSEYWFFGNNFNVTLPSEITSEVTKFYITFAQYSGTLNLNNSISGGCSGVYSDNDNFLKVGYIPTGIKAKIVKRDTNSRNETNIRATCPIEDYLDISKVQSMDISQIAEYESGQYNTNQYFLDVTQDKVDSKISSEDTAINFTVLTTPSTGITIGNEASINGPLNIRLKLGGE